MDLNNMDLNNKTMKQLKVICKENKYKGYSKLKKVTLFTDGSPYCDTIKKHLDQEGISYIEKTQKKYPRVSAK